MASAKMLFDRESEAFLQFHRQPVNVLLHCITTPVCLVAVLCQLPPIALWVVSLGYSMVLLRLVPMRYALPSCVCNLAMAVAAVSWACVLPRTAWLLLFLCAYFGQDAAHWMCGEPTYQSSYLGKGHSVWAGLRQLAVHTLLLVPLCVLALCRVSAPVIAWWVVETDTIVSVPAKEQGTGCLDNPTQTSVGDWVSEQTGDHQHKTRHWWGNELPHKQRQAYETARDVGAQLLHGKLEGQLDTHDTLVVEALPGMDELYCAFPTNSSTSSDGIFTRLHLDNFYMPFPGARVYRCLVGLTPNERVQTCFPHEMPLIQSEEELDVEPKTGDQAMRVHTLTTGDFVAFDFCQDLHYIRIAPTASAAAQKPRILWKLHYLVYPKGLRLYGALVGAANVMYNRLARLAFLKSIDGNLFGSFIVYGNIILAHTDKYCGLRNLAYLWCAYLLSLVFGAPLLLTLAASYRHYVTYICTFYHRRAISYGKFKRNAMFFKTCAISLLVWRVYCTFGLTGVPLWCVACWVVGFGLSSYAASAIGLDRTYFGAELGWYRPKWIAKGPYGVIPHPMIVGSATAMLGFAGAAPGLALGHVALYTLHALQEEFGVHRRRHPLEPKEA